MFELRMAIEGRLAEFDREAEERIAAAMMLAAEITGDRLKRQWRRALAGAGLSQRLQNTIRHRVYPTRGASLRPAVQVYSQAGYILRGLTEAITITGTGGNWLAIPTEFAPARIGRGAVTPDSYEARFGAGRLAFVPLVPGRSAMLVDNDLRARAGQRGGFTVRREGARAAAVAKPIFWLVRRVRTRPVIALDALEAEGVQLLRAVANREIARELSAPGSGAERVAANAAGRRGFRSLAEGRGFRRRR